MNYFAYGSNMNLERITGRSVNVKKREAAVLEGYRLEFNKVASRNEREGYANIVKDENGVVEGILYVISEEDLEKLDKEEACPNHYRREKVIVRLKDGREVEAITYIANPERVRGGLKPTREYLNHLLAGREFLSDSYYAFLESQETLD